MKSNRTVATASKNPEILLSPPTRQKLDENKFICFSRRRKERKNSQQCIDIDQVVWASKLNLSFQNVQQNVNKRRTPYQTSQQGDSNIRVQRAPCWCRHRRSGIQLPNRYVRTLFPGRIDGLPRAGTFSGGCKILKNNLPAEASACCHLQSRKKLTMQIGLAKLTKVDQILQH